MRGVRVLASTMAVAGLIALSACGGGGGGSSDDASGGGAPDTAGEALDTTVAPGAATTVVGDANATIQVMNYTFTVSGPIPSATAITITNKDKVDHTFTNPDGAFDVKIPAGGTADLTVATPGTYKVVCTIHKSMGTQVVAT